jgi:hypothetical protein
MSLPETSPALVRAGSWLTERWLTIVVGLCAAGPVIASTLRALIHGWMPAGDQAIIATRSFDVLSSHTPLVGQYSDASTVTHHTLHSLGPMLYWLLALPARFGSPETMALWMGTVNTLAILASVALARRRGGPVLMVAIAIAIAVMCRSLPAEVFHDVWNPAIALFPFTLLILLCWSLACGEYRLLPLTVLVASFVAQCQLAFLPPTLGLLAIGLAGLVAWRRRLWSAPRSTAPHEGGGSGRPWRWALAALAVLVICWTPAAIDQVSQRPGNLTSVVRTATATKATLGTTVGWRAVVRAIGVPPWWLIDPHSPWDRKVDVRVAPRLVSSVSCLLMLGALLALAAVGLRRRRADLCAGALIALALCAALAGVAATTPNTHLLASTLGYTMWWGSPVGMFVWIVLGWSAAVMASERGLGRLRVPAFATALGVGAAALAGTAVAATEKPDYHLAEYRPLGTMFAGLNRGIPPGRTVLLVGTLGNATMRFRMAARYALVRHGIRPLSPGAFFRLGTWYELDHHRYDCVVYVNDGSVRPGKGAAMISRVILHDNSGAHPVTVWTSRPGC